MPSSFDTTAFAQATIALCALSASLLQTSRLLRDSQPRIVTVEASDAAAEFRVERLALIGGRLGSVWDKLAGQYRAKDGWLRPHVNWKHHRIGLLDMLGLPENTSKDQLAQRDATDHGKASATLPPISIERIHERPTKSFPTFRNTRRPLDGIRILDLTRVIAGPTAGRTLAGYGADVLWVTAPHLPCLPDLDFETSRGKRTIQLDLRSSNPNDRRTFEGLVKSADVILQSYRPGGLDGLGYGPNEIWNLNPDCIYASLTAWGRQGPLKDKKGFDSLVQFATGINQAEGESWQQAKGGTFEPKPLPCQALDHGAGYMLAFGIQAALIRRASEGGSYIVRTSLLSMSNLLRSLGRVREAPFDTTLETLSDLRNRGQTLTYQNGFDGKTVETVRHAARINGLDLDPEWAAQSYADSKPEWLE
ncbi:hypothetical protein OIV83_003152 [Microbotryomycetes sp. JL201]|nr:hypothetical protein OIV83_003152 [Microbotryomycetes sp. JL201]